MIVLDSYAVLALLKGEPAAGQVEDLLNGQEDARMTPVGVAEVIDILIRTGRADEDGAVLDIAQLGLDSPEPIGARLGIDAGLLRARHHHRTVRAISLADCVAAVVAQSTGSKLATADPHLLDVCRIEGIRIIPLPDSSGAAWSG